MPATMRDVAALAGVSLKTVSRVVNLQPHIRPEVAGRVRAAIAELGWVPNPSARALRTGRTGVVAVAVPHLRSPYAALLTEAIVNEATRRGLQSAVEPTGERGGRRIASAVRSIGSSVDGVVVVGPLADAPPDLLRPTDPVVAVQAGADVPVDAVDVDLVEAASLLARHLVVMGRTRPLLLGWDRFHGGDAEMTHALVGAGFGADVARVDGPRTRADGAAATRALLDGGLRTDALVCGSDELAVGALAVLAEAGIAVPDDVMVCGFDNIEDGAFTTPSLTTIDPLPGRLARVALDLLTDRLTSARRDGARRVVSQVELVRRESTMGAGLP
jgi:DNA-binding LacI/PurR family transcriptional regulator